MGVRVKTKALGIPGVCGEERELSLGVGTLSEAKKRLLEIYANAAALDKVLLAFVNGKVVRDDWDKAVLSDGDSLLFVVPISGG